MCLLYLLCELVHHVTGPALVSHLTHLGHTLPLLVDLAVQFLVLLPDVVHLALQGLDPLLVLLRLQAQLRNCSLRLDALLRGELGRVLRLFTHQRCGSWCPSEGVFVTLGRQLERVLALVRLEVDQLLLRWLPRVQLGLGRAPRMSEACPRHSCTVPRLRFRGRLRLRSGRRLLLSRRLHRTAESPCLHRLAHHRMLLGSGRADEARVR